MFLMLYDRNPEVVFAWTELFAGYEGVRLGCGDLLTARVDAVVSPANGLGFMDGGIDLAYRNLFGLAIQRRAQMVIEQRFGGEIPVGEAFIVPTGHGRITRVIVAPTMKTPRDIRGTDNVYRATKAALTCSLGADPPIERLGIPGMGTGIGRMDPHDSARQVLRAALEVMKLKPVPASEEFDS